MFFNRIRDESFRAWVAYMKWKDKQNVWHPKSTSSLTLTAHVKS